MCLVKYLECIQQKGKPMIASMAWQAFNLVSTLLTAYVYTIAVPRTVNMAGRP